MLRMIGKTPTAIVQSDDEITFTFDTGETAKFYHERDCCECVYVDDVNGDWNDLIGVPVLVSEERTSHEENGDFESVTWTFYTFRSINGSVDVRWCGSSNGYYSESVYFSWKDAE